MATKLSEKLWQVNHTRVHWCPGCKMLHLIDVDAPNPHTGARWTWDGNVEAPTFSPSVNIVGWCHYFLKSGKIDFLSDCRHSLAGQTVPLPDMPIGEIEWLDDE